ncbi:MAG: (2Fe-2S)-binding protein [Myxococcaceae bacterium]|jgi:[NiFe] hydrogenase diaphorase moiety small subunit|nr:(2Fe-2S)-binding protein [Myxococcaceae bacterium]
MSRSAFTLDGAEVPFDDGQTLIEAARAARRYVPFLCAHPDYPAHGSCRVCTVLVNGRPMAACTTKAAAGQVVESDTPALTADRRALVQMLFVEGNHFCPGCEKSGGCTLQSLGIELGVTSAGFAHESPVRPVDASHPDLLLDFDRCILCELCVRASADVDGKHVFALSGRGLHKHLIVNAESGRLVDTGMSVDDAAASVCPVGVILKKRVGFSTPIGQRPHDVATPRQQVEGKEGA